METHSHVQTGSHVGLDPGQVFFKPFFMFSFVVFEVIKTSSEAAYAFRQTCKQKQSESVMYSQCVKASGIAWRT